MADDKKDCGKYPTCIYRQAVGCPMVCLQYKHKDDLRVVRCSDCKHCDPENLHCDHPMSTTLPVPRKPDDYCSYGERKANV